MKNCIYILALIASFNIYSQNKYESDSLKAYALINKEITFLKEKGVMENGLISFFDDTGKIFIAWKEKGKYRAIKMHYKGEECKKRSKQKLSNRDKKNIDNIFKNPQTLSGISNLNCDERAHAFNKIHLKLIINNQEYHSSFYSHCLQNSKSAALTSLYFSLRK